MLQHEARLVLAYVPYSCHTCTLTHFTRFAHTLQDYFKKNGEPLFSSHMLDLSEEPIHENLEICKKWVACTVHIASCHLPC